MRCSFIYGDARPELSRGRLEERAPKRRDRVRRRLDGHEEDLRALRGRVSLQGDAQDVLEDLARVHRREPHRPQGQSGQERAVDAELSTKVKRTISHEKTIR